ncbi:ankyrin [Rhizodiscina lignyota]|uniref:Ankyrin n=1 Tax=Rhizodiscina lignyota TaxID=1504668 RepID=A0A9P4I947_9PEZI|nr:ankyrin [Rhizodiscina lignyota]
MDPLSLTTAAITLTGAVLASVKLARGAFLAADEVASVIEELSDLQALLNGVSDVLRSQQLNISSDTEERLEALLSRATVALQSLNEVLQGCLKASSTTRLTDRSKVERLTWVRKKATIKDLMNKVRECRANITASWSVVNASISAQSRTTLDDLLITANMMSLDLKELRSSLTSNLDQWNDTLTDMFNKNVDKTGNEPLLPLVRTKSESMSSMTSTLVADNDYTSSTDSVIINDKSSMVKIEVPQLTKRSCRSGCGCKCHIRHQFRLSARALDGLFGAMFLSYVGFSPSAKFFKSKRCSRCTDASAVLTYYFPSWLIEKVIAIKLSSMASGITASLSVSPVIPESAEVLRYACHGRFTSMVSLFQKGLASPQDKSIMNGTSPLTFAIRYDQIEICQLLLVSGADPYDEEETTRPIDEVWEKILSGRDTENKFRNLLTYDEEYIESKGFSLIHKVVLDILCMDLESLLNASAEDIDRKDGSGKTAVAWAALRGDNERMSILLTFGADPTIACKLGRNSLHYAARGGSIECMRTLLLQSHINIDAADNHGNTALHWASQLPQSDSTAACSLLLTAGADIDHCDRNRWCPVFWATERNDSANLDKLLDAGAEKEIFLRSGLSPLSFAVQRDCVDALQVLLDHGAEHRVLNNLGRTVLHLAALHGSVRCIETLAQAKLTGLDPEVSDKLGFKAQTYLLKREDFCDELLSAFSSLLDSFHISVTGEDNV